MKATIEKEKSEAIKKANDVLEKVGLEINTVSEIGGTNPPPIKDEK